MPDSAIIPEPYRALSLRLREAFATLRIGHHPGGQVRDQEHGFLWSPTDEKDWSAGGDGDLAPNLSHATSRAILVGMLVERGWTVNGWFEHGVKRLCMHRSGGVDIEGYPVEVITEAFEWLAANRKETI